MMLARMMGAAVWSSSALTAGGMGNCCRHLRCCIQHPVHCVSNLGSLQLSRPTCCPLGCRSDIYPQVLCVRIDLRPAETARIQVEHHLAGWHV